MTQQVSPATVTSIGPDELRQLMTHSHESDYVLVDVRQPEEYAIEHIPGAKLIPLMDIEERIDEVQGDRKKIFYCRSGGRSSRVANYAVQARGMTNVYNLQGGTMAYRGVALPGFPNLKVLEPAESVEQALRLAMNLEKGAERFYKALHGYVTGSPIEAAIEGLAAAEEGHARTLYDGLERAGVSDLPPFEELYESLPGDLLESGEGLETVFQRAQERVGGGGADVLELAVEMEHKAYDLYRSVAEQASSPVLKGALLVLAEQEKKHARVVLKALGMLVASE